MNVTAPIPSATSCAKMKVQVLDYSQNDQPPSDNSEAIVSEMQRNAEYAAAFLKALAHQGRLLILCHLNTGEKSVTELENLLSQRQAAVSQQLARLRMEGLVRSRRQGKTIYYSISDPRAARMIALMYDMFCAEPGDSNA